MAPSTKIKYATNSNEEKSFLKGPRDRWREFFYTMGVVRQFIRGFRALHFVGPCITFFGSARISKTHEYYEQARLLAFGLSKDGFTIMTGGGRGIMEAANKGAQQAKGMSIGCNIVLPSEQAPNNYLDKFVLIDYFFVRKELLRKYSCAFVVFPGGYGTLDEFFETLTLAQTGKSENFPIILFGLDFHKDLISHFERMKALETISKDDLKYVLFTDNIDEARFHINQLTANQLGKFSQGSTKPLKILGEKKAFHSFPIL
ncbi:MAG: TIGR00730 family Rossman fold protein [Flavobacterium sp.]|nr:MAG: TIGR00730 family Rossman fold protein [Flavobacterium sp.]